MVWPALSLFCKFSLMLPCFIFSKTFWRVLSCLRGGVWAATHCNTLPYTATHCNTLQLTVVLNIKYSVVSERRNVNRIALQHTTTHYNTLQHTTTHCSVEYQELRRVSEAEYDLQRTATHCNTLQHTATQQSTPQVTVVLNIKYCVVSQRQNMICNALQRTATHCTGLQHTATHRNTPQHIVTHLLVSVSLFLRGGACTATHCNTLQHTATHCNILQHTATRCNTLQHTRTHSITLQDSATHCNTLQHTATHCNTLQHTFWHVCRRTSEAEHASQFFFKIAKEGESNRNRSGKNSQESARYILSYVKGL